MARANVYAGVVLTAFAIYFVYESLQLPFWSTVGPGAGALPLASGLLLGAVSVVLVVRSLRGQSGEKEEAGFDNWRAAAAVLGAFFLAVLMSKTLGMLLTIFLFMAFHTMVVERVRWMVALPTSVATAGMFYLLFEKWLDVPLVIGVLGI